MSQFRVDLTIKQLNIPLTVSSGQAFSWRQIDDRWLGIDGPNWFLCDVQANQVVVETNGSRASFEHLLRLEVAQGDVESRLLERGGELKDYIEFAPGLRVMRSSTLEAFIGFLCTPNNNLTRIIKMVEFIRRRGPVIDTVRGHAIHQFPELKVIAGISEAEMRAAGFGYRAATIPVIAEALLDKENSLDNLGQLDYPSLHARLMTMKGIGPKLADCIALFAFDKMEAVPIDTHIWQAARRLYFPEWQSEALTATRYRMTGDHLRTRFGDLAGWAQQYLFYDNMMNWRTRKPVRIPG